MIYLDYNATTPVCAEARNAMLPFLNDRFGNPASGYGLGKQAHDAVEKARSQVADLINAEPEEIFFTSCATESNNWVLCGVSRALAEKGNKIVTTTIEHPAITNPAIRLMEQGHDVAFAEVDANGVVKPDQIKAALTEGTVLVSVMHANNESGVIQPIGEIAALAKEKGVLTHTDAAQSLGKIPVNVEDLGVDYLTIAGHKLYAPKGVGALYIKKGSPMEPWLLGGGQEGGLRSGTENVIHIAGLGAACERAAERLERDASRITRLRGRLLRLLNDAIDGLVVHGAEAPRLPNTLFVSFPKVSGDVLLSHAHGLAASTGAACHGGADRISHVLTAMDVPRDTAMGTVRLSLGRYTKEDEVEQAARILVQAWEKARGK